MNPNGEFDGIAEAHTARDRQRAVLLTGSDVNAVWKHMMNSVNAAGNALTDSIKAAPINAMNDAASTFGQVVDATRLRVVDAVESMASEVAATPERLKTAALSSL